MSKANILIVDDDKIILDSLCEFLSIEGYETAGAATVSQAKTVLNKQAFALVITDVNMPDGDGFELLNFIRENYPQTVTLLITGYGTIESAVEAIKKGAYDYLTKPIIDDDLLLAVERATRQQILLSENQQLRQQLEKQIQLKLCHQPRLQDVTYFRVDRNRCRQQNNHFNDRPFRYRKEPIGKIHPLLLTTQRECLYRSQLRCTTRNSLGKRVIWACQGCFYRSN